MIFKKLVVILGPTASGKSELAVKLALRLGGSAEARSKSSGRAKKRFKIKGAEIVSADSRQVYKGMDIGTGKITKKEMRSIPHHLLDVISPKKRFTVVQYQKLAIKAINKIFEKDKVPILCGGSGFYIQAVVDGAIIPEVPPDWKLRKKLEKKPIEELYKILKKIDPKRAKTIERKNPRRLIRAIEIVIKTKKTVPFLRKKLFSYPVLIIGVKKEKEELEKLIKKRLSKRLKQGMVAEVKKLRKAGLSWKRLEEFGLEYRYIAKYLQGKLNYNEMVKNLQKESEHYSKRQMTWFKRDKRIYWLKKYQEAEKLIKEFLK